MSGSIGNVFYFASLSYLPIGDATCFNFASGMITTTLSWLVLKDPVGLSGKISLLLTFIGTIFVSQPKLLLKSIGLNIFDDPVSQNDFDEISDEANSANDTHHQNLLLGIFFGFCVLICFGTTNFVSRAIGKEIHWLITLIYYSIFTVCFIGPVSVFYEDQNGSLLPNRSELYNLLMIGIIGTITQLLMILSYIYEQPYKVVLITSMSIVFAFVYDFVFHSVIGNLWSYLGAMLILLSVIGEFTLKYLKNKV